MSSSRRPPGRRDTYDKASSSYGAQAKKHISGREVEAQALLKAARKLQDLQTDWDSRSDSAVEETLKYNRQIWVIFYDHALSGGDAGPPQTLRSNIANLAGFVFKRSVDILANPTADKLSILISINREIAAGLMSKTASQ